MAVEQSAVLALVAKGDAAGLAQALAEGGDPDARDRWGVSALAQAAAGGKLEIVQLLLDKGAQVDKSSDAGNTPLMLAAARGHDAVVAVLLAAGAKADHRNKWGVGPTDWAKWAENDGAILARLNDA